MQTVAVGDLNEWHVVRKWLQCFHPSLLLLPVTKSRSARFKHRYCIETPGMSLSSHEKIVCF
jgi:hypothetical protein